MKRIFILTFVLWMIVMIAVIMHILIWFVWYYHSSRTVLVIILTYHSSILKFETFFAAASAYLSFFFIIPFFLFATSLDSFLCSNLYPFFSSFLTYLRDTSFWFFIYLNQRIFRFHVTHSEILFLRSNCQFG